MLVMAVMVVVVMGHGVSGGGVDVGCGDGDGEAVVTEVVSTGGRQSSWLWQGLAIVIELER